MYFQRDFIKPVGNIQDNCILLNAIIPLFSFDNLILNITSFIALLVASLLVLRSFLHIDGRSNFKAKRL